MKINITKPQVSRCPALIDSGFAKETCTFQTFYNKLIKALNEQAEITVELKTEERL